MATAATSVPRSSAAGAPAAPRAAAPAPAPVPSPAAAAATPPAAVYQGPPLKYLGFFRAAAIEIYFFLIQIYEHLKDKSGSFKPGIQSVESTVQTVVGPVISRVHFDPDEYLKFVDTKVDGTLKFAEDHTPQEWRARAAVAYEYLAKVPERTHAVVEEYNQKGAAATAQSYYEYFVPIVAGYLLAFWHFINALPLVPQLISLGLPYAVFFAQQYNSLLAEAKKSDLPLAKTLTEVFPPIPVEKLKKSE